MKLIHTSDWHFGMKAGSETYQACQEYFLEQLYALIRREGVEAVLCAGDVYDSGNAGANAIELFNRATAALCAELNVKFILIAGNHDSAPRLAAHRTLLKGAGMYVTGRLEREIEPVLLDGGKVAVYPIPYFSRDEVAALFPERREEIGSQEAAFAAVCDHIRETMDPARKNIVMAHAYIVGAELSESDRAAQVGFSAAVSKDVFRGFDYVALGHIHKPQAITDTVRYSGCPIKYSFGKEETQEKGVVLIDTDRMEQRFVPLSLLRDRKTVEGTYAELIAREAELKNTYLRLRVADRYAGLELQSELRERFPYLLEIYGKGLTENDGGSMLSAEELDTLDDVGIMLKFMAERFEYAPTEEQVNLFREVLAWSGEEEWA